VLEGANVSAYSEGPCFDAAIQAASRATGERGPLRGLSRFRPHEKMRSSRDFLRVKRIGRRLKTPHFGFNYAENELPYHRLGLVVQKRFWHAVNRNWIKRQLREWFRLHKHLLPLPGKDIVIIARPGAERLSSKDMAREFLAVFAKRDGRSA
jgi:ribonuclease P protein component